MKQAGFTVWFVMLVSLVHGGMSLGVDEMRIEDVGTGLIIALATTALLWRGGVAVLPHTGTDTAPAAEIDAAIAGWSGSDDPVEVPGGAPMSPGHAAIGVLWARDWAAYFRWMVRRSHPAAVGAAAPGDHT